MKSFRININKQNITWNEVRKEFNLYTPKSKTLLQMHLIKSRQVDICGHVLGNGSNIKMSSSKKKT